MEPKNPIPMDMSILQQPKHPVEVGERPCKTIKSYSTNKIVFQVEI